MALCIVQMQFLFFTSVSQRHMTRHKFISRFGLMHMLATNLCEWLYVIIEEAKHEIVHIAHEGITHDATAALLTGEISDFVRSTPDFRRCSVKIDDSFGFSSMLQRFQTLIKLIGLYLSREGSFKYYVT